MPRVCALHFGMDTFNILFRADVYRGKYLLLLKHWKGDGYIRSSTSSAK